LIYAGVGNRVEAEELTSRVFDLAAPCLGRCTPHETRGLLVRVARSVVEDHWQALSRGPALIPDRRGRGLACRNTNTTPTADTALPTAAERADRLLRLLPAREREVLTYRFLLNRSVREIADLLLVTDDAVKALVYRALKLAAELERTMS
jgi:DNA-directed RNA polymerase specialized sigma24 family protein